MFLGVTFFFEHTEFARSSGKKSRCKVQNLKTFRNPNRSLHFLNILTLLKKQDQAGRKVGVKDQTGLSHEFEDLQKSEMNQAKKTGNRKRKTCHSKFFMKKFVKTKNDKLVLEYRQEKYS